MALKMWNGMPMLEPDMDLTASMNEITKKLQGDFCLSTSFDADFLARLIREGFLTMAERIRPGQYLLLPKLHVKRCLVHFEDLHVQRRTRRAGRAYAMSIDQQFQEVLRQCVRQHGENWLHVPLRETFTEIHGTPGGLHGVRLHSVEVWEGDKLVAGEVGTSVGGVYTSLSGFCRGKSAGAVQCTALALVLQRAGFAFWDLGMSMPYKIALGAHDVPRLKFLAEYRRARDIQVQPLKLERTSAKEIFGYLPPPPENMKPNPNSKRQQKKRLRAQRRREAKQRRAAERAATVPPVKPT